MNTANALTVSRIAATPYLGHLVLCGHYRLAAVGLLAAGVTDYLDGYVARTRGQRTVLGSYLDPLADKLLVNVFAGTLAARGILPAEVTALIVGRDALLVAGAAYGRYRSVPRLRDLFSVSTVEPLHVTPHPVSKANTAAQIGLVWYATASAALGVAGAAERERTSDKDAAAASTERRANNDGDEEKDSRTADPLIEPLSWVIGCTTVLSGALYARAAWRAPSLLASSVFARRRKRQS